MTHCRCIIRLHPQNPSRNNSLWLLLFHFVLISASSNAFSVSISDADIQFLYKHEIAKLKMGTEPYTKTLSLYEKARAQNHTKAKSLAAYILGMNAFRRADSNTCYALLSDSNPRFLREDKSRRGVSIVPGYCLVLAKGREATQELVENFLNRYQKKYPEFFRQYKGLAYYNVGNAFLRQNQTDNAIAFFIKAEEHIGDENVKEKINLFSMLSVSYINKGEFDNSITYAIKSLEMAKLGGDKTQLLLNYFNLTSIYSRVGKPEKAVEIGLQAKQLAEELGDSQKIAHINFTIATAYQDQGKFTMSEDYLQQALEIAKQEKFHGLAHLVYGELGTIYFNRGDIDLAIEKFKQSLAITNLESSAMQFDRIVIFNKLAQSHLQKGDFEKALDATKEAEKLAQTTGVTISLLETLLIQSQAYEGLDNYEAALASYKEHLATFKQQTESQYDEKLAELEARFETKNKQQQIDDLRQERKIENLAQSRTRTMALSGLLISVTLVFFLVFIVRKMREREQLMTELQSKNNELESAYSLMEELALTDPLTKLKNRRAINEELKKSLEVAARNATSLSLILSDVDHFKAFNDNFGHDCGDYILQSIAEKLQMAIRNQDSIGRWGGEEFIIILPNTDAQGAISLAESLKRVIGEAQFKYQSEEISQNFSVTMTFGIAEFHPHVDNLKSLVNQADQMLYVGKEQGRNRVVYRPKVY